MTKETDVRLQVVSQKVSKTLTGYKQSLETGQKISAALLGKPKPKDFSSKVSVRLREGYSKGTIKVSPRAGRGKGGYRIDLGHYVRSSFEANYCRFLKWLGVEYRYEPKRFVLTLPNGTTTYAPDLFLPALNLWRELKGYMREDDALKLKLFKEQYPSEEIDLVFQTEGNWTKMTNILKNEIPNWE